MADQSNNNPEEEDVTNNDLEEEDELAAPVRPRGIGLGQVPGLPVPPPTVTPGAPPGPRTTADIMRNLTARNPRARNTGAIPPSNKGKKLGSTNNKIDRDILQQQRRKELIFPKKTIRALIDEISYEAAVRLGYTWNDGTVFKPGWEADACLQLHNALEENLTRDFQGIAAITGANGRTTAKRKDFRQFYDQRELEHGYRVIYNGWTSNSSMRRRKKARLTKKVDGDLLAETDPAERETRFANEWTRHWQGADIDSGEDDEDDEDYRLPAKHGDDQVYEGVAEEAVENATKRAVRGCVDMFDLGPPHKADKQNKKLLPPADQYYSDTSESEDDEEFQDVIEDNRLPTAEEQDAFNLSSSATPADIVLLVRFYGRINWAKAVFTWLFLSRCLKEMGMNEQELAIIRDRWEKCGRNTDLMADAPHLGRLLEEESKKMKADQLALEKAMANIPTEKSTDKEIAEYIRAGAPVKNIHSISLDRMQSVIFAMPELSAARRLEMVAKWEKFLKRRKRKRGESDLGGDDEPEKDSPPGRRSPTHSDTGFNRNDLEASWLPIPGLGPDSRDAAVADYLTTNRAPEVGYQLARSGVDLNTFLRVLQTNAMDFDEDHINALQEYWSVYEAIDLPD